MQKKGFCTSNFANLQKIKYIFDILRAIKKIICCNLCLGR